MPLLNKAPQWYLYVYLLNPLRLTLKLMSKTQLGENNKLFIQKKKTLKHFPVKVYLFPFYIDAFKDLKRNIN